MKANINSNGLLEVHICYTDLCHTCRNMKICPLINAVLDENVFLHYEDTQIEKCGLFRI